VADWSYGDAGDRWEVRPGDLWSVGPHRLLCDDLHDTDAGRFPFAADAVYVDPPWNSGNEASFRTKASLPKAAGSPAERWRQFCYDLTSTLAVVCPTGPWFIEGTVVGRAEGGPYDVMVEACEAHGHPLAQQWQITYYRKQPCLLGSFGPAPVLDLTGLDDEDTPAAVIGDVDAATWFDPCAGRGLTAVSAHAAGRTFVGMELNPRRMAVTIDRLVEGGAGQPERQDG